MQVVAPSIAPTRRSRSSREPVAAILYSVIAPHAPRAFIANVQRPQSRLAQSSCSSASGPPREPGDAPAGRAPSCAGNIAPELAAARRFAPHSSWPGARRRSERATSILHRAAQGYGRTEAEMVRVGRLRLSFTHAGAGGPDAQEAGVSTLGRLCFIRSGGRLCVCVCEHTSCDVVGPVVLVAGLRGIDNSGGQVVKQLPKGAGEVVSCTRTGSSNALGCMSRC